MRGSHEHVFTTLAGRPISSRYVQQMVERYAARAGIKKNVHPDTLRHSFATDLYGQTTNIRLTQRALGHSNLSTAQIYTHIVDEELERAQVLSSCVPFAMRSTCPGKARVARGSSGNTATQRSASVSRGRMAITIRGWRSLLSDGNTIDVMV